jgi:hypothetical protein
MTFLLVTYLNALSVHNGVVHFQNGCLDGARGRQDGETNVDGVGTLGIQNCNLFLPTSILALKTCNGNFITLYGNISY